MVVPSEALIAEFGSEESAPPALTLYNCSKRGVSTPQSMKPKAMPALKKDVDAIAKSASKPNAVLLDNLPQILAHAEAATRVFAGLPDLIIAVDCTDATAESRFLARARGDDDAAKFRRRIARYRKGSVDVRSYYERYGNVVKSSTEGEAEAVYENLVNSLSQSARWQAIVGQS